jgi:hypothetical protein
MRTNLLTLLPNLGVLLLACALCAASGYAQTTNNCTASTTVSCAIPNLFEGKSGITLPVPGHEAHFDDESQFTANFLPLNTAVASQLTLLPLPSPASGFTFETNKATNTVSPRAQTLGPILTERGETLGARRAFVGFAYQRFRFDKIDGVDMDNLPIVFTHAANAGGSTNPGGNFENDVITANNKVDLRIDQYIMFGSFGILDRTDLSVAVPIMNVRIDNSALATIQRLSGARCSNIAGVNIPCHFFNAADVNGSTTKNYSNAAKATGIGDITIRGKQNVYNSATLSAAILADVRLPTGDEKNFLGAGAVGFKPFFALSWKKETFSPHVNVGYQWNGSSILAGDISTGEKKRLPSQFFYSFGSEIKASRAITVTGDFIGQRVLDSTEVSVTDFSAFGGAKFPTLTFTNTGIGVNDVSIGMKYGYKDRFQFTFNGLISVDNGGVRQRFTPLFGFSLLL